jgi:malate synthase
VHNAKLEDGSLFDGEMYQQIRDEQVKIIAAESGSDSRLQDAAALLDTLVLSNDFPEFLTVPGYSLLR